ncbi:ABC transporter ATP-binding protein [Roseobacter sp.]|uniref:ABC transporter ATP-binding protein n=1 Tax=Roseobacter sp. TaxID=1907202 RepID=UPI00385B4C81
MSTLEIRNLSKSFGALSVSQDINITIPSGACHALIGPNGAGKTTLIHQISGVLKPDAGQIALDGVDMLKLSVAQRAQNGLGRTFQITSVLSSFSVLENVAIAAQAKSGSSLRFFKVAAQESSLNDAAMATLARVGLKDRADVLAANLSHGELRLLELGIALAGRPKFLLLDEPMAGLGRTEGLALIKLLASLRGSLTMLLVEHDMDAIFQLADAVYVLVDGVVVAQGSPDAVREDPAARTAYLGGGTE